MEILLLGATGQIGYSLALMLAKHEHHLRVLVRNRQKLPFPNNVELRESQQFTVEAYKRALEDVELAIYAIGLPEQFTLTKEIFERVNCGLLAKFLEAVEHSTVKHLVYLSTYEVFSSVNNTIRESYPIADASKMTPYFQAMTKAYQMVDAYAADHDLTLTTIHPAAVYGGINTGDGLTSYIEKLLKRQRLRIPMIIGGRFPLVHVDSLADAIIRSFDHSGAFIISDQITQLRQIAVELSQLTHQQSVVPPTAPLWLVRSSATLLEIFARTFKVRPLIARVQIEFITNGFEPLTDKAQQELLWTPRLLSDGLTRYLNDRERIPRVYEKVHS